MREAVYTCKFILLLYYIIWNILNFHQHDTTILLKFEANLKMYVDIEII